MKEHEKTDLDKVTILLPSVSRGGPGLKKKYLTDAELESLYQNHAGTELVCDKCDKHVPIRDKPGFRKHLVYHNLKEKKYLYQCTKCPLKFTDNSNLKRHILSIHERQVFRCLHCDFEDNRKKRLQDHMNNAHKVQEQDKGEGSTSLRDLNDTNISSFNTADADHESVLLEHDQAGPSVLQRYSYQCTGCKFRKRKLAAVEDHIKEQHAESPDLMIKKIALQSREGDQQVFACKHCDSTFKKKTLLNQHNYKVHEIQLDTEHTCSQCGVSCASLSGLQAHTRAHLAKKFLCANCNKSFLILSQLKDHVDRGICVEENRKCNVCGKLLSSRHHLELHMRIHNNEKPFQCKVCKKRFTQSRNLKEHYLTHEAERRFKCQHCDKKFVQKNHLKYHMTSFHMNETKDIPKHVCQQCGKGFPFPFQLKKHLKMHVNSPSSRPKQPMRITEITEPVRVSELGQPIKLSILPEYLNTSDSLSSLDLESIIKKLSS